MTSLSHGLADATAFVLFALWLVALATGIFAFVHALRQRPDAFPAVDKLTKPVWLGILGVGTLVIFAVGFVGPGLMLSIAGTVAILVYLVDVRPRVDEIQRR